MDIDLYRSQRRTFEVSSVPSPHIAFNPLHMIQRHLISADYWCLIQEYLPPTLLRQSSHSANPDKHILKSSDVEAKGKEWDEGRLADWERDVQGGSPWEGRDPARSNASLREERDGDEESHRA